MTIKTTLLALSAMVSFSGFAQAAETCATKCSTKVAAKTECATKCATKCAKTEAAKAAAMTVSTKTECATKCATKCAKTEAARAAAMTVSTKEICATKCATKEECATKCKTACAKTEAAAMNVAHFNVSGMTCGGCSKALTTKLNALEGVSVKKVCHKSGSVDVVLSEKATAEQVKAAITAKGFKIVAPAKKG